MIKIHSGLRGNALWGRGGRGVKLAAVAVISVLALAAADVHLADAASAKKKDGAFITKALLNAAQANPKLAFSARHRCRQRAATTRPASARRSRQRGQQQLERGRPQGCAPRTLVQEEVQRHQWHLGPADRQADRQARQEQARRSDHARLQGRAHLVLEPPALARRGAGLVVLAVAHLGARDADRRGRRLRHRQHAPGYRRPGAGSPRALLRLETASFHRRR